jgi:hypothetical protein
MKIKARTRTYPSGTPPFLYSFEGEGGVYAMTGDGSGRKWTPAAILERFDVIDDDDLYWLAKEAREELDLDPHVLDADVVDFCRVELAPLKLAEAALAKAEGQKAPDVVPLPPEPAPEPEPEPEPEPAPAPAEEVIP